MDNDKFNKHCAEVMEYIISDDSIAVDSDGNSYVCDINGGLYVETSDTCNLYYNPYDDLNQRKCPFDKLWQMKQPKSLQMTQSVNKFKADLAEHGIDKATKDLIISTMED